jgi:hypothetical protein
MTQITSIKLGLTAICIATVTLSLAQTPRTGTSGSNKASSIGTAAGHSGLSGNFSSAVQTGTNFRSSPITGANTNIGAHTGIIGGAQTGISNQTGGIMSGAAAGGFGSSIGNSGGTTQIGTNARAGTNTTSTNAGAQTAAAAPARVATILPQLAPVPFRSPLPNNSPVSSNFSTAGQSPSPLPSAPVTPTPTPSPARFLGG